MTSETNKILLSESGDNKLSLSYALSLILPNQYNSFNEIKLDIALKCKELEFINLNGDISYIISLAINHVQGKEYLSNMVPDPKPDTYFILYFVNEINCSFYHYSKIYDEYVLQIKNRKYWTMKYLLDVYVGISMERNDANTFNTLSIVKDQVKNQILLIDQGVICGDGKLLNMSDESSFFSFLFDPVYCDIILKIFAELVNKDFSQYLILFQSILMSLHYFISKLNFLSTEYTSCLCILQKIVQIMTPNETIRFPFANLICNLPNWNLYAMTTSRGLEFQSLTYLGPFFAASIFADDNNDVALKYFKENTQDEILDITIITEFRKKLEDIWKYQFLVLRTLLQEKSTHKLTVDFITQALFYNKSRSAIRSNESEMSSEGFINNLCVVLQMLVEPIKIDKVDMNYLTTCNPALNNIQITGEFPDNNLVCSQTIPVLYSEETRINVDREQLIKHANTLLPVGNAGESSLSTYNYTSNFHTECYYLTAYVHHLSILPSLRKQNKRKMQLLDVERLISQSNNVQRKVQLEKFKLHQKQAMQCANVILQSADYLNRTFTFYIQTSHLLLQHLPSSPYMLTDEFSVDQIGLYFSCWPQFILEDFGDFLLHILQYNPIILSHLDTKAKEDFLTFIIFICTNSHLIKSPYLVSKFIEILFYFMPSVVGNKDQNNSLRSLYKIFLMIYPVKNGLFVRKLIEFYIDVEKTGASTEFYDKFSIRFRISIILRTLWKDNHKTLIFTEACQNQKRFIKFINRAINDMVYLLEESITALKRVRQNQELRANTSEWENLSQDRRNEVTRQLNSDERITKNHLTLADVTVEMICDFTDEIKEPFLSDELIDKLVSNMDFLLKELTGPNCIDLKVTDPEKYHWNPKKLLQNLVRIYMNLDSEPLVRAISEDERYYSTELFRGAVEKLTVRSIVSNIDAEHFGNLFSKVEELIKSQKDVDIEDDDIPSHFLDPIMGTLMRDPVMLPQSRTIVELSVIKRHLLNDDCDPFNRQPLTLDDLIPQVELKNEIETWKKQKIKDNASSKQN